MPAQKRKPKSAAKKPAPSTKPLWQKLFIKGGKVLLVNAPTGYASVLDGSPATITTRASGIADTILMFADDQAHLGSALPRALESLGPWSNLWIAYRKGDKTFHRDTLGKFAMTFGIEPVSLVAVDDTWSAMRFKRT